MTESSDRQKLPIAHRFRGFLPVVLDLETGGFNSKTDALLESAIVILEMNDDGFLVPGERVFFNIEPFEGANIEQSALEFTGIDPNHPFRMAVPEKEALIETFRAVRAEVRRTGCNRAIIVAHNASFDQGFLNQAVERCSIKRNPFHPFSAFDTATLCGLAFGQTVLARACQAAGIEFDSEEAHSAKYDCDKTAEVFCHIVNRWRQLGGLED
ncbi:MAG: ribonuclease T [Pseudomonadales bacterium]|nr:ribonuclease T [Pseudomonadales bacterium]